MAQTPRAYFSSGHICMNPRLEAELFLLNKHSCEHLISGVLLALRGISLLRCNLQRHTLMENWTPWRLIKYEFQMKLS